MMVLSVCGRISFANHENTGLQIMSNDYHSEHKFYVTVILLSETSAKSY